VFCLSKIVRLSNCLQEQQLVTFSLKMQVKHKYEVNTFNAIFLLNKLQILKLLTGTIIIILLKKEDDHIAFETWLF
jgi:hypothetical protein